MAANAPFAAGCGWLQFGLDNDESRRPCSIRDANRNASASIRGSGAGRALREREVDRGHMAQVERNRLEMRRYDGHCGRK